LRVGSIRIVVLLIRQVTWVLAIPPIVGEAARSN
jgi:hypothetical protein